MPDYNLLVFKCHSQTAIKCHSQTAIKCHTQTAKPHMVGLKYFAASADVAVQVLQDKQYCVSVL